jgi:hypothetical protein
MGFGGSSEHTPVEKKDTLRSRAMARGKDVLSEGEVDFAFPDHPLQCIILDGTPIENKDGVVFTDGHTTLNSFTFTTTAAHFVAENEGDSIYGDNIPPYTTVQKVNSATNVTLSKKARATGNNTTWGLNGSLNFTNFYFYLLTGTQDQSYIPGFDAEESPTSVGVVVKYGAGQAWARVLSDAAIDAVSIDILFPRLEVHEKDGDTVSSDVELRILVNNVVRIQETVHGKASQAYIRSYLIELAGLTPPWTIKVERMTPDSTTERKQDLMQVNSFTEIIYAKLKHPNTAVLAYKIDAEQFPQIPVRAYRLRGIKIQVPTNYDPITRAYATTGPGTTNGTWDGTFKMAATDNWAWCWYALATNRRWGAGDFLTGVPDKFTLYEAGKICDQTVPDGKGGTEPRFSCNLYLQKAEDASKVLSDAASMFRALIYFAEGKLFLSQDVARTPKWQFSPANVIEGRFAYSGTGRKARHTAAQVKWNDPEQVGEEQIEYVEDAEAVADFGVNQLELSTMGCNSRGQAHRFGVWSLLAEKYLTDTVSFATGLEGFQCRPGDVIQVQDPFRAGKGLSGRIKTATTTSIVLDRTVTLEAGKTYTLSLVNPATDALMTATVTNASGNTATLTFAALATAPEAGTIWMLAHSALVPEQFQILAVTAQDAATCAITALKYNPNIYEAGADQFTLDELPVSVLPSEIGCKPPGPITITESAMAGPNGVKRFLEVSWVPSEDYYLLAYIVAYRFEGGTPVTVSAISKATSATIEAEHTGVYEVDVWAMNTLRRASTPSIAFYALEDNNPFAGPEVSGLEMTGLGNIEEFRGRDVSFSWRLNSAAARPLSWWDDPLSGERYDPMFESFEVSIWQPRIYFPIIGIDTPPVLLLREHTTDPHYTLTLEKSRRANNIASGVGLGRFQISVRAQDKFNNYSRAENLIVSNAQPGYPENAAAISTLTGAIVSWDNPPDEDLLRFEVGVSASPDASGGITNIAEVAWPGDRVPVPAVSADGLPRSLWVRSVDVFENVSPYTFAGEIVLGFRIADVVFSPNGGYFEYGMRFEIFCSTPDTDIWFTFFGSDPRDSDNPVRYLYTGFHYLAAVDPVTIKAVAQKRGLNLYGNVTSRTFTPSAGEPTVSNPTLTPIAGTYALPAGQTTKQLTANTGTAATVSGIQMRYNIGAAAPSGSAPTPPANPTPTSGTVVAPGGAINMPTGWRIIKIIAYRATGSPAYNPSSVTSYTYRVSETSGGTGGSSGGGGWSTGGPPKLLV